VRKVERKLINSWSPVADAQYAARGGKVDSASVSMPSGTEEERMRAIMLVGQMKNTNDPALVMELLAEGGKMKGNWAWQRVANEAGLAKIPFATGLNFIMSRASQKDQQGKDVRQEPFARLVSDRPADLTPEQLSSLADTAKRLQGGEQPQSFRLQVLSSLTRSPTMPFEKVVQELRTIPVAQTEISTHTEVMGLLMQRKDPAPTRAQLGVLREEARRLPPEYGVRLMRDVDFRLSLMEP
jgi:hypothetical protein